MILYSYETSNLRRVVDLQGIYKGSTLFIIGGAPTIKEQPLHLLQQPGVVSLAINNAGMVFRPTLWVGLDPPACYSRKIIEDPGVLKLMNMAHTKEVYSKPMTLFVELETNSMWEDMFKDSKKLPWYGNTFFSVLSYAYYLGFRSFILLGCPFKFSGDNVYANSMPLTEKELLWNKQVYKQQLEDILTLKPIFDDAGISITDCTIRSSLKDVYPTSLLYDQVQKVVLNATESDLPHCSKFANNNFSRYGVTDNASIKEK